MSIGKTSKARSADLNAFITRLVTALVIIALFPMLCHAQTVLPGAVVSSKGAEPVAGAFVYAYDGSTLSGYAISDGNGTFNVKVPSGKSADRITVSCMGFKTVTLMLSGNTTPYKVVMEEQKLSIKESKVTSSVVEEKGDTLSYTAGAFADGTERTIGDLLQKLPDITVTDAGGILYKGTYINKFYVEGMDLMGGNYGVVTNNLSADKIARVEVYKKHQPIKALVGINETDRSAVNIVLKESARNTWLITGDAVLGTPEFPLFDSKLLLSRFSKKSQDLYLIKGNNVGNDIMKELIQQQYFGRTGVVLMDGANLDADFQSRQNPSRSVLSIPQEYWFDNLSSIGSFNHLDKLWDDLQIRASLQLATEQYEEMSNSTEEVHFGGGESLFISENLSMADKKHYLSGKVAMEKNSADTYTLDELSFSGQLRDNESDLTGSSKAYRQSYELPSFKIENDLNATFRTRAKHALSLRSLTKFVSNNHQADYVTDMLSAHQDFNQRELKSNNQVSSNRRYNSLSLTFSGGINLDYQNISASLSGIQDLDIVKESSLNAADIAPFINLSGTLFVGKSELAASFPAYAHFIDGCGVADNVIFPTLTPMANIRRTFSPSLKAEASASYSISRSPLESLLASPVMSSYRAISTSDSLNRHDGLNISATVDYSDNIKFLYASLTASHIRGNAQKTSSSFYTDAFTITGYQCLPTSTESSSLSGKISKYFGLKTLVVDLRSSVSRMSMTQYLQNELHDYTTDSFSAELKLRSSPTAWLSAEALIEYINSLVHGGSRNQLISVNGAIALKPFEALTVRTVADYHYESVPGMTVSNIPLVKTEAVWKLNKMSIVAECRNLFDCTEFRRSYVDTYRTLTSVTRLSGRQYLLGLRLSL